MDTSPPTAAIAPPSPAQRLHAARRLETLSDIVFGLAMTFLVSRLPMPAPGEPAPSIAGLVALLGPHLSAMAMSFSIATLYWFGHHRRLALSPPPGPVELILNFLFLLLIMLLPTTTDLYGRYGSAGSVRPLYCAHLCLLSLLALILWTLSIHASRRPNLNNPGHERLPWRLAAAPAFSTAIFAGATLAALNAPPLCNPVLYTAFLTPLINRIGLGRPRMADPNPP